MAQECVKQLLHLHQVLHRIDTGSRHILVRKKTLQCLKLCIAYGVLKFNDACISFHKNMLLFQRPIFKYFIGMVDFKSFILLQIKTVRLGVVITLVVVCRIEISALLRKGMNNVLIHI